MINNNDVMKKLRVALHLRDKDIVRMLKLANFETTENELSAIFRREDHPNYRPCGDQLLRRFLDGLIIQYRGKKESAPKDTTPPPPMLKCEPLPKGIRGKAKEVRP